MSEPTRGALRLGFAVCLTALVVGPLHVPQPFLALLATQLLIGIPCRCAGVFFSRLASAAAGSLGGLAILTFAPNSQWLSLPLFFAATGWGTAFVARRRDPAGLELQAGEGACRRQCLSNLPPAVFPDGSMCKPEHSQGDQ